MRAEARYGQGGRQPAGEEDTRELEPATWTKMLKELAEKSITLAREGNGLK